MPFKPDNKGYDFKRLHGWLNDANLAKENNALYQILFSLINGVEKQEVRFETEIKEITKAITVDNNGNITARNLTGTNTGNIRLATPSSGFVSFANSSSGQVIQVSPVNLTTEVEAEAGTYNPTLTNVTNLSASTVHQATYIRITNICFVFGLVDVDPIAAGTTVLGLSLPIASNLGVSEDLVGTAACPSIAGQVAILDADTANDRAQMEWIAVDITNKPMYYHYSYRVL